MSAQWGKLNRREQVALERAARQGASEAALAETFGICTGTIRNYLSRFGLLQHPTEATPGLYRCAHCGGRSTAPEHRRCAQLQIREGVSS